MMQDVLLLLKLNVENEWKKDDTEPAPPEDVEVIRYG
jgi:hypothetical protein